MELPEWTSGACRTNVPPTWVRRVATLVVVGVSLGLLALIVARTLRPGGLDQDGIMALYGVVFAWILAKPVLDAISRWQLVLSDRGIAISKRRIPWGKIRSARNDGHIVISTFDGDIHLRSSVLLSGGERTELVSEINGRKKSFETLQRQLREREVYVEPITLPDPNDPEPYFDAYTRGQPEEGEAWPSYEERRRSDAD